MNKDIREIKQLLTDILINQEIIMATLDTLVADVAAEDTVIESAVALLGGLSTQIAALKTTQTDSATAAKIDQLSADVVAKTAALSTAVAANTPVATATAVVTATA